MENKNILNLIKELVEKTNVNVKNVDVFEDIHKDGSKTTWFKVDVSEPHFFTSHDGEALLALNHVIKRIIENKSFVQDGEEKNTSPSILIDVNDFQKKKIENIHALAHMMAERARYFKSNIEIDPMSAFERRIIHEFLADAKDLKTESEGTGMTRRVVIKYIGRL